MQQSISEKQGAASAEEILERLPKIYANLNEDYAAGGKNEVISR